mgnify:FL=1
MHSGDQDISNNAIDCFELVKPGKLGIGPNGEVYGYRYGNEQQSDESTKHTARIDIKYLSEMLCDMAEEILQDKKRVILKTIFFELK